MLNREHQVPEFELLAIGKQLELNQRSNTPAMQSADDRQQAAFLPQAQPVELPEQEILANGTTVNGKYEILGVAGKGGMGIVYKARHITSQRIVAVKMLRKEYSKDGLVFRRFQKEAHAANLLNHPNIIAVHDFGMRSGNQAYLTMDFLTGRSLMHDICPETPLALDRFKHIFVQACNALEHAHRNGLVHRDIKPSNLLLTQCGHDEDFLVIVDFGLVKLMTVLDDQRLTTTNTLVGSPLYMSPEQCTRMQVDHRSDIYSLGCTMYEALTGYLPHHGSTPLETFCKHITEEPQSLNKKNPIANVPPALERAVLKALSKDPADRQQSMGELREEIEKALAKPQPVSLRTSVRRAQECMAAVPSMVSTLRMKPVKRKKPAASVLSLLFIINMVALVVLGSLIWLLSQRHSDSGNHSFVLAKPQPLRQMINEAVESPPAKFTADDGKAFENAEAATNAMQTEPQAATKPGHPAKKHGSGHAHRYYYYYYR